MHVRMFQSNLGTAAIIGELLNRGVSFWDAPKQLILFASSNDLVKDISAAKVDALIGSTKSLCESPFNRAFLPNLYLFRRSTVLVMVAHC